jgi:hypothetical protein
LDNSLSPDQARTYNGNYVDISRYLTDLFKALLP